MVAVLELISGEDGCVMQTSLSITSAVSASAQPSVSPSWKRRFLLVFVPIFVCVGLGGAAASLGQGSRSVSWFSALTPAMLRGDKKEDANDVELRNIVKKMFGNNEDDSDLSEIVENAENAKALSEWMEDVKNAKALSEDKRLVAMYTVMGPKIGQLNQIGFWTSPSLEFFDVLAELRDPSLYIFSTMKWQGTSKRKVISSPQWVMFSNESWVDIGYDKEIQFVVFSRSALGRVAGDGLLLANFASLIQSVSFRCNGVFEEWDDFYVVMGRLHYVLTILMQMGKQPVLDLGLTSIFTTEEFLEMTSAQLQSASQKLRDGEKSELSEERKQLHETARRLAKSLELFRSERTREQPILYGPRLFIACLLVMNKYRDSDLNPDAVLKKHFIKALGYTRDFVAELRRAKLVDEMPVGPGRSPWIQGYRSTDNDKTTVFMTGARQEETISFFDFHKEQRQLEKAQDLVQDPRLQSYYTLIGTQNATKKNIGQLNELHFGATASSETGRVARLTDPSMGIFSAVAWGEMIKRQVIQVGNSGDLTAAIEKAKKTPNCGPLRVQLELPEVLTKLVDSCKPECGRGCRNIVEQEGGFYIEMDQVFELLQRLRSDRIGAILNLGMNEVFNDFELRQMQTDQLTAAVQEFERNPESAPLNLAKPMSQAHQRVSALVAEEQIGKRMMMTGSRLFVKCLLLMEKHKFTDPKYLLRYVVTGFDALLPPDELPAVEATSLVDDLAAAKNMPDIWIGGVREEKRETLEPECRPAEEKVSVYEIYDNIISSASEFPNPRILF